MRRIPLSRRSHITGFQTLPISGLTEHESALERDFAALTTFRDAAARIISQPITVSFREGPTPRRYTPDFLVHWSDGRSELVEVSIGPISASTGESCGLDSLWPVRGRVSTVTRSASPPIDRFARHISRTPGAYCRCAHPLSIPPSPRDANLRFRVRRKGYGYGIATG